MKRYWWNPDAILITSENGELCKFEDHVKEIAKMNMEIIRLNEEIRRIKNICNEIVEIMKGKQNEICI